MRKETEILERIRRAKSTDPFGFEWQEYIRALSADSLNMLRGTLVKADAKLDDWIPDLVSDDAIRKQCVEYMEFAWEKANGCRGVSAMRSLQHYKAWLWMLGEDGFDDIDQYRHYGKDHLVRICKFLDLDAKKWDDGRRVNSES